MSVTAGTGDDIPGIAAILAWHKDGHTMTGRAGEGSVTPPGCRGRDGNPGAGHGGGTGPGAIPSRGGH